MGRYYLYHVFIIMTLVTLLSDVTLNVMTFTERKLTLEKCHKRYLSLPSTRQDMAQGQ